MKLATLKSNLSKLPNRLATPVNVERLRGRSAMMRQVRIKARDLCTCASCGRITADVEIDHRIPLHLGGSDTDDNLQLLCTPCHKTKTKREAQAR